MSTRIQHLGEQSFLARYEALFRVSKVIGAHRDRNELFRILAHELKSVVDFDFVGLYLYDEASHRVHNPLLATLNGPGFAIPVDFPAEETITWWVYRHQESVVVASRAQERRFPSMMEVFRQHGVESACILPLTTAHRRLGSLGLGLGHANGYCDEEVRFLRMVADQVALALDNAVAEDALRRQKIHFEKLFDLAPDAIVLRDEGSRVLRANQEFTTLFGFTLEEAAGKNLADLIVPEEHKEESAQLQERVTRGERVRAEVVRRKKDGTLLHVELVSAPVCKDGAGTDIYTIYRDITQRKQAEEALRRSEAYLAEGQRLSHTGSWARSVATGELFFSQESYRIFGLDPSQTNITIDTFLQRVHPDDRTSLTETIRRAIVEKSHFERDYRLLFEDGTIRHIHVLAHPVMDARGNAVEFVGTHMDVTEQHRSRGALEQAFEEIKTLKDRLYQENVALRREIDETSMFEGIVGKSVALREILEQVETVAPTESTVLIYGETGTGKELIARAIHNLSARRSNAFVKLNCAAIPSGLLESELFGHEKGAFTGALAQRIGRFELADRGTVFLDEVGETPLELQPKLLRVLQEREFERLGSSHTRRTDARLIAATNRDLEAMVEEQRFRADLFYRLNVFPIRVPALRERPEDLPLLAQHFAELFSRRMRKTIKTIPPETMAAMMLYDWPGNVRELQNVIERAVILSSGGVLEVSAADLTPRTGGKRTQKSAPPNREQILQALQESKGRVGGADGAAARLGLKRTTLIAHMKRLGISPRTVISNF